MKRNLKSVTAILIGLGALLVMGTVNAEMVVIVSDKNPTASVSQADVEKIFLGKMKLFPDGSSAIPLDLPEKSLEKNNFYEKAMSKTDSQLRAYWSRIIFTGAGAPPKAVESPADMVKLVAENPNTIGYVDKSLVAPGVKVVWQVP